MAANFRFRILWRAQFSFMLQKFLKMIDFCLFKKNWQTIFPQAKI